jgi:DNA-binding CsgD family transcriptional regulator
VTSTVIPKTNVIMPMDKLKGKDIDEVINLMQLYPTPVKASSDVTRFFQETQKTFNSDELVFLFPDSRTNGIDVKRSFVLQQKEAILSRYANYFWKYDPLYSAELSSEQNALVFRTQDVMPYKHFVKLEYYYDFLRPQNLFSELVIRLFFKSFFLGAISLLRSKNKPLFNKTDIRKAELLIPYIVNTIDVGDIFAKGFEEQKLFERWLESQAEGIIFLDSDFHTLYFNSKASFFCLLLAGKKATAIPNTRLLDIHIPHVIIQDCRCLARYQQGKNNTPGYDNRIVNLANQQRYHLQYFTFSPEGSDNTRPGFIIIINDLSRYNIDADDIISSQSKLSNREAVVARYAGLGWTNKEIADNVHSSPFTIQNQLKKVFEKTGLKNRTQLASLMKYSDAAPEVK